MSFSRVLSEQILDAEILKKLPQRDPLGNKGTFGHVLIIGGSENMCGAALFAAKAAYRAGCGLVRIVTPECNRVVLQTALPEAILTTYGKESLAQTKKKLLDALLWADACVIGPGLGMSKRALFVTKTVFEHTKVPTVADADAINLKVKYGFYFPKKAPCIITPHMGEFARLVKNPVEEIRSGLAHYTSSCAWTNHVITVAKDAHTAISDGGHEIYINKSGSSALAKGGTGDVLAGLIGALLARGVAPFDAAKLGVYIHGLAGQYAARTWGEDGVLASEVADCIAYVIKDAREGKL